MKRTLIAVCLTVGMMAFNASKAQAIGIQFATVNISGDLWQYSYFVTDFTFDANQALFIDFDSSLYSDLQETPASPNADWSTLTFPTSEPTPGVIGDLPPGSFVALSLVSGPSLADPFTVAFTWPGAGTPGSQPFTVFQLGDDGIILGDPIATGTTQPVPEPATFSLIAMGAAIVWSASRRRRQT